MKSTYPQVWVGVQVDPVGQASPLSIQVERGGGMLLAVASVSKEMTTRLIDSILAESKFGEGTDSLNVQCSL